MTTFAPLDPVGSNAVLDAARWVQGTMLGSVATAIAVLAVATVGLLMLNGRIEVRRGIVVIVGCFLLFGAPTISAGLLSLMGGERPAAADSTVLPTPSAQTPRRESLPPPSAFDPYAGASVPQPR